MYNSPVIDIASEARRNKYYRRVVYTGELYQLVVMTLRPYEEIGYETHRAVEQVLFIVDGTGTATVNGYRRIVRPGEAVTIDRGARHNLVAGPYPLRLWTVYVPPNHIDGRVHRTRADAEADVEDEAFGKAVERRSTALRRR